MKKAYRGKMLEMIGQLNNLNDQLFKLYKEEEPNLYLEDRESLKTRIKGKNVCDFGAARMELTNAIRSLYNILCRQFTDEG